MFMDCYKTHWCPYSKYHQPWCLYVMSQHLLDYHEIWSTPSWLPLDSLELLRISAGSEYIMLSMLKQYESGPLVSVHLSHARLHSYETTNKPLINRVLLMEKTMTCETWTISNSRNCTTEHQARQHKLVLPAWIDSVTTKEEKEKRAPLPRK